MPQWITSVLKATWRADVAKDDLEATMHSELAMMKRCVTKLQANPHPMTFTCAEISTQGHNTPRHIATDINMEGAIASFAERLILWTCSRQGLKPAEAVAANATWLFLN
jgi:hypothetical protein